MAVANRSELLDGIEIRLEEAKGDITKLSQQEQAFIKALEAFTTPSPTVNLRETQKTLNFAYDKHGLQAAAAAISYEDQGAASKVKASTAKRKDGAQGWIEGTDTNFAEVDLTKMVSKNAGANQAHKAKLVTRVKEMLRGEEFIGDYNDAIVKAGGAPVAGLAYTAGTMSAANAEQHQSLSEDARAVISGYRAVNPNPSEV